MGVKLTGFDTLADDLKALETLMANGGGEHVKSAIESGGDEIADAAKRYVHSRDGKLAVAIKTGRAKRYKGGYKATIGVHREDWSEQDYYPAYVEFGHAGKKSTSPSTPPHPYLRTAFDAKHQEVYTMIREALFAALREINM